MQRECYITHDFVTVSPHDGVWNNRWRRVCHAWSIREVYSNVDLNSLFVFILFIYCCCCCCYYHYYFYNYYYLCFVRVSWNICSLLFLFSLLSHSPPPLSFSLCVCLSISLNSVCLSLCVLCLCYSPSLPSFSFILIISTPSFPLLSIHLSYFLFLLSIPLSHSD